MLFRLLARRALASHRRDRAVGHSNLQGVALRDLLGAGHHLPGIRQLNYGEPTAQSSQRVQGSQAQTQALNTSVYETEPAYDTDQPKFLNACCVGWTRLSPLALLDTLKALERNAGRDLHGRRFGPRELDLDILLYGDEVVQTDRLTVPHQGLPDRAFVLVPLAEIAGAWTHPQLGVSIADLAAAADPSGGTLG